MAKVTVNEDRCKGCGYCATACIKGVIALEPTRRNRAGYCVAVFNREKDCSGCALCATVCPDVALEVS